MTEQTWYAIVFVDHHDRRMAIAKSDFLDQAKRIALRWEKSSGAKRIEIQRNPDKIIVWTSGLSSKG